MYYIQNCSNGDGVVVINGISRVLPKGKSMTSVSKPNSYTTQIRVVAVPDKVQQHIIKPGKVQAQATTDTSKKTDAGIPASVGNKE